MCDIAKHYSQKRYFNYTLRSGSLTLGLNHGLRTPNEGITQRYLKNWADEAYASVVPKNLGLGLNFRPCSEGYFPSGCP